MKGQGIVEYVLIFVLIACVVIVCIAVLAPVIGNVFNGDVCSKQPDSFACTDLKVQQCLQSEKYNKDQCVLLIGGAK